MSQTHSTMGKVFILLSQTPSPHPSIPFYKSFHGVRYSLASFKLKNKNEKKNLSMRHNDQND